MGNCHRCGSERDLSGKIGFNEVCRKCYAYLHCCKNCRFFDSSSSGQCRETQAELVSEKEKGNHCEYFEFAAKTQNQPDTPKQGQAKDKFDSLFKK